MRPSSVARCACGARWHQIASRTSHCASCHETFSSEWAWEEHRTGPHPRTCLDPSLLTRKDGTPALRVKVDREGCAVWTPPPREACGMSAAILCGNGCGHDHNSPNGPSGCCDRHGAYLYYCPDCHGEWRAANSDRAAQIERLARASLVAPRSTDSERAS